MNGACGLDVEFMRSVISCQLAFLSVVAAMPSWKDAMRVDDEAITVADGDIDKDDDEAMR
jgi:hypothetical protein